VRAGVHPLRVSLVSRGGIVVHDLNRGRTGLIVCALLLLAAPAALPQDTAAELGAPDALGRPGRALKLRAKLEKKGILGINPDVKGEPLDFYLVTQDAAPLPDGGKFLGSGDTDGDGNAEFEWTPPGPGQYACEARIRRGSKYIALPAPFFLAVPPSDRPVILVNVDGTVSTATNIGMFRGTANDQIAVVDGARAMLATLATSYQLVYLTDLDQTFATKFKDWMHLRELPTAPIMFWELFERSLSHATYMEQLVTKLKRDFPQVSIGIGPLTADVLAYRAQGLAAIQLTTDPDDDLPPEVLTANRWEVVLGHVVMIHRAAKLLRDLAGQDAAAGDAALAELSLLGKPGLGYVHRFRTDSDPNLAAAATLVTGRIVAADAFVHALDLSAPNQTLAGLIAAWRSRERAHVLALYRERKAGLADAMPTFRACELVSRNEPEPGKVVFKLRLLQDGGAAAVEREVVIVRGDDGLWKVDVQNF
jgi:hypothetical protein